MMKLVITVLQFAGALFICGSAYAHTATLLCVGSQPTYSAGIGIDERSPLDIQRLVEIDHDKNSVRSDTLFGKRVASLEKPLTEGEFKFTLNHNGTQWGRLVKSEEVSINRITGEIVSFYNVTPAPTMGVYPIAYMGKCQLQSEHLSPPQIKQQPILGEPVIESPHRDSVRTALTSANTGRSPPIPEFSSTESRLKYLRWLRVQMEKLKPEYPELETRKEFLQTVWYESKRAGLDTSLVLGLIETVSKFKQYYVSEGGSRGYMAISQAWALKLGDGDLGQLFHTQTNLRFGCVLLRHYLDASGGDLYVALEKYFSDNIRIEGKPPLERDFYRQITLSKDRWAVRGP